MNYQPERQMQHLPSALGNSRSVPQVLSKNEKIAAARLPLSAALDIAADLLAQFPNCKAEDGFLQSMAQLFNEYPASLVSQITSMRIGLATKSEFLSLAAMSKWLSEKSETLIWAADWDRRATKQIEDRTMQITPPSALRKMQDWTDRRKEEKEEENRRSQILQAENTKRHMTETNENRAQEYRRAGIDPVYVGDSVTVVSLHMMLHMGWRIEVVDGRKVLTQADAIRAPQELQPTPQEQQ